MHFNEKLIIYVYYISNNLLENEIGADSKQKPDYLKEIINKQKYWNRNNY